MSEIYGEAFGKFALFSLSDGPCFPDFIKTRIPTASDLGLSSSERSFIMKAADRMDKRVLMVLSRDRRPMFVFGDVHRWIGACIAFVPDISLSAIKDVGDFYRNAAVSPLCAAYVNGISSPAAPGEREMLLTAVSRLMNVSGFLRHNIRFGAAVDKTSVAFSKFALCAASMCGVELSVNYDFPASTVQGTCDVALFAVFLLCVLIFGLNQEDFHTRLSFYCDEKKNFYAEAVMDHAATADDFLAISEAADRDNVYFALIGGMRAVISPSKKEVHYLDLKTGIHHLFGINGESEETEDDYDW